MSFEERYPHAAKFWGDLPVTQRVAIYALSEALTPQFSNTFLEFLEGVATPNIGRLRAGFRADLDEFLAAKKGGTVKNVLNWLFDRLNAQ